MSSLPIIDEGTVVDPSATTNDASCPLGYSTIYRFPSNNNLLYSTNSTESDFLGPGRVLGNLYDLAGKRIKKSLADITHSAGFGPEAIFQKISTLYHKDWKKDKTGKKGETICTKSRLLFHSPRLYSLSALILLNLCLKLLEHTK